MCYKKENSTSRFKVRYCIFCLDFCLPHFANLVHQFTFGKWQHNAKFWNLLLKILFPFSLQMTKYETYKNWRTSVMWGGNFKMMFSVGTFVITGTDMWVRCPLNKSNSGHSFTGSANLKNHFVKVSVSIQLKKNC